MSLSGATKGWEYNPIPRYYFLVNKEVTAEIVFDGFHADVCNDFSDDGQVWRAIVRGYLLGRFPNLQDAQKAVGTQIMNRGLALV